MTRVVFIDEARADALEAYRWYEAQREGLGAELREELRATIERIRAAPLAYAVVHRRTRRAPISRFPYGVFYRASAEAILIVGVIHGRRHPRDWMRRA